MSAAAILAVCSIALLVGAAVGLGFGLLLGRARAATRPDDQLRLKAEFDELAGASLKRNNEIFLQLARESLGREHTVARADLAAREAAIAQLLTPVQAALRRAEEQVAAIEKDRHESYATLRTQIEVLAGGQAALQRETRNLVTALRRPEVRGRWGEVTLRRVVELSGMSEHCDFTEQMHVAGEEGSIRPDLIVHLPGARDLIVDAKAPLDAYLEALEAQTDEARKAALSRHAQQVEKRIRELGSKSYWEKFARSPEFAVLFVPGEQFLGAALAERPELMDSALRQGVILATPATLMALLKTVAYGWRQSDVAANAEEIRALGQALHKRLGTFTSHLAQIGQRLGKAVESYNQAVGSLERQVLPAARRFNELGVTADQPLATPEPIELLSRELNPAILPVEPATSPQQHD